MKVVLAEKPSVARDIARALGAHNRRDGYFEGNDYTVTYAFGHLVAIAEPEQMNPKWGKPWRVEQLPMLPERWSYRIADKASAQFNIIKRLFSQASSIVCATDAGREGEHIFRLIYMLAGCNKPVQRLWISSLTQDAILNGFRSLKASRDFDNLANAAMARAHADWIVGLNFTRAYTTINHQLCTVGRVQTPTLALIVARQAEIEQFKAKDFYEILATFEPGFLTRYITPGPDPQTRLQDKATAQAILDSVAAKPSGLVQSVTTTEKKTRAPSLYDLLTLQKDANKRFGYTAQETLDIAQDLYEEHKLLSYPRTESRHLSTDMVEELPGILSMLLKSPSLSEVTKATFAREGITAGSITASSLGWRLSKNYVDDTKLTDHHAIIPTAKPASIELTEKQRNIYQLVVVRFLSVFLPPEIRDETTVIVAVGQHAFRARGFVIKDPGWTILDPKANERKKENKESEEESQRLPPLENNQAVLKRKAELKEGKTTPPKPYDDSSLLTAMKNAGQDLDDDDLANYMKQSGLGTPATRAAIIERLLQTGYLVRNKKTLLATDKGKALITSVHGDLKNVSLTASWEQQLADMQDGKLSLSKFESDIASFVRRLLPEIARQPASLPVVVKDALGPCPNCKQGSIRLTPKAAGCSRWREGCKFVIWREQYGKKLTDGQIGELFKKGRTKVLKGFKKKSGAGTYNASLVLSDDYKVRLEFDDSVRTSASAKGKHNQD